MAQRRPSASFAPSVDKRPVLVAVGLSLLLVTAALWPTWAGAQTTAPAKQPVAVKKPQVKQAATKPVAKPAAKAVVKGATPAVALAGAAPLALEAPLTELERAVAAQVHLGAMPCELGKVVRMEMDATTPGFFRLHIDQQRYRLRPVESRTGAVRLEDPQQGVVWIQLANKSMLMSQKLGRRLADECAGESQQQVAAALKINPAPSLLEPLPLPAPVPTASAAMAPTLPGTLPAAVPVAAPTALPTPAVVANDCRRASNAPANASSNTPSNIPVLPSGVELC